MILLGGIVLLGLVGIVTVAVVATVAAVGSPDPDATVAEVRWGLGWIGGLLLAGSGARTGVALFLAVSESLASDVAIVVIGMAILGSPSVLVATGALLARRVLRDASPGEPAWESGLRVAGGIALGSTALGAIALVIFVLVAAISVAAASHVTWAIAPAFVVLLWTAGEVGGLAAAWDVLRRSRGLFGRDVIAPGR